MSFNRLQYDDAAYDLQMERAVKPGDYRLFQGSYDNCEECYPYNQPTNHASASRSLSLEYFYPY